MQPPWDVRMKICCSNVPGHMTKMTSRSIYGKHIQKNPSEPRGWWPWNLVYSIGYSGTNKFVQTITLGWPWPWSNLFPNVSAYSHTAYSHVFPSLFLFSIYYALRWAIQDQWSSGLFMTSSVRKAASYYSWNFQYKRQHHNLYSWHFQYKSLFMALSIRMAA